MRQEGDCAYVWGMERCSLWRTAVHPHARAVPIKLVSIVLHNSAHSVMCRVVPARQVHMHLHARLPISQYLQAERTMGIPVELHCEAF